MLVWVCIAGSIIFYFMVGYHVFHTRNQLKSLTASKSREPAHVEPLQPQAVSVFIVHMKSVLTVNSNVKSTSSRSLKTVSTALSSPKSRSFTQHPQRTISPVSPSPLTLLVHRHLKSHSTSNHILCRDLTVTTSQPLYLLVLTAESELACPLSVA
jgi:hypothetical protein